MKRVAGAALSVLAGAATLGVLAAVRASDHFDGARATANPQADITDVFCFTSPENPANVVLAMAVTPYASASSSFSTQVDYVFRVRLVTAPVPLTIDPTVLDVACHFDQSTPQVVRCSAPQGLVASAIVGDTTAGDAGPGSPMRVFAGLRSDPAFFDRQGSLATIASNRTSFAGQNAFAHANVLAIVVEIDAAKAFLPVLEAGAIADAERSDAAGSDARRMPVLAVAAETLVRPVPQ
jgi:Domain of unknown function (DUF4331)